MNINNFYWWLLILLNFASYFTYSYGQIISRSKAVQFVGGVLFILSFVAMFIFFGLWSGVILIAIAFVLVAPIVGLLMAKLENKLYGHYKESEPIQSSKLSKDDLLLRGLNKGMVNAHKNHKHLHPELKDYNMSNIYISFFHHSDNYIEEFSPQDDVRPSFYWFGDRYYNHMGTTYRYKYFYLFLKNPKKSGLRFRERYEGFGFNSLYSRYLKYKKERDQNLQKGSPEAPILLSFSKITPDLILEFEDESSNSGVIIKPEGYRGLKITLFDNNNMPIQFTDIPEIVQILPKITHSLPFVEPKKEKDQYIYEDWLPMVTEKMVQERSKNLLRALNEGAMKNRKTY